MNLKKLERENAMEKVKKFFKWLWGNKLTLTEILINVIALGFSNYLAFSDKLMRFHIFQENALAFRICLVIFTIVYAFLNAYTVITKYGLENLDEINKRLAKKAEQKLNALTPEQKKVVKEQLETLKETLSKMEAEMAKYEKDIQEYVTLKGIQGFQISNDLEQKYQIATNYKLANKPVIDNYKRQIETLEAKL